jgi:cyclohexyl-isocyanide hydratase
VVGVGLVDRFIHSLARTVKTMTWLPTCMVTRMAPINPLDLAMKIAFLLYPHLTQLDLTGPAQVFAASGAELFFAWKNLDPVPTDATLALVPNATFASCPQADLICVPGGPGQLRLMDDKEVLGWLARQAQQAQWVTSVCSGSLLLGAAGLLKGYRAASHWNYREHLPVFGAIADDRRVVRDRNRITGGGVTAGIDMALEVLALTAGEALAKQVQLQIEYAPQLPFNCGRPELADEATIDQARASLASQIAAIADVK